MADDLFEHPRLAAIYDALESDRSDLDVYAAIADELGARSVLDVGCGTGTFCLLLAERGLEVTGVVPADGSLAVARAKPGTERVNWVHGSASALPPMQVDLATMTANVSQAIAHPTYWEGTLVGIYDALRPGGHLVFETRDPASRAWLEWTRAATQQITEIAGVGAVQTWVEVVDVSGPLVTFRGTYVFASDGQVLTSDSRHFLSASPTRSRRIWSHTATPSRKSEARPTGPGGNWCPLPNSHSEKVAPVKFDGLFRNGRELCAFPAAEACQVGRAKRAATLTASV